MMDFCDEIVVFYGKMGKFVTKFSKTTFRHSCFCDKIKAMIPKIFKKYGTQLVYIFSITGFFLLFILLYEPRACTELLHCGEGYTSIRNIFAFNISIFCSIILVTLFLTRTIFFLISRRNGISLGVYIGWCVGEAACIAAFLALYATLMDMGSDNYFSYLGRAFRCSSTIIMFPYVIVTLSYYLHVSKSEETISDETRIKFYDNRHLLKLVVLRASVLYIEAQENYLHIHYVENDREKVYELRNSMKSVEELCEKAGFTRIHRSYIVNPTQVKSIEKSTDGHYFATINAPSEEKLVVSKKYQEIFTKFA